MNIVHCITGLSGDGAQRMLLRLVIQLKTHDINSMIVNLGEPTSVVDTFHQNGIEVRSLGLSASLPQAISGARQIRRIIDSYRPDLVQAWMYHANIVAMAGVALGSQPCPLMWNIRRGLDDFAERGLKTRTVVRGNAWMSRIPQRIIYCSYESRAQHEALGFHAERGCVLENGFDTLRFSPSSEARSKTRARLQLEQHEIVVGNVARFDVAKGHPDILEAFALTASHVPAMRLVLVGRGVDQSNKEITAALSRLGLCGRVLLLGEQESLEAIYPAFDIYCSSSLNEGFPNAISEAMACEVPCVVTDTGASRQLVDDISIVVRTRQPLELSGALTRLARMSEVDRAAIGRRLRERIVRRYSMDSAAEKYAEVYRAAVSAAG